MENAQPVDNHQTLKLSRSSDPHHHYKALLIGLGALLIIAVASMVGYLTGINQTQNTNATQIETTVKQLARPTTEQLVIVSPSVVTERVYTDNKLEATFEYPSNWKVDSYDQPDGTIHLVISDPTVGSQFEAIYISYSNNPQDLDLETLYRKDYADGEKRFKDIKFENVPNNNGVIFKRLVFPEVNNENLSVLHNKRFYDVTYSSNNEPVAADSSLRVAYDHIVSTFKFVK